MRRLFLPVSLLALTAQAAVAAELPLIKTASELKALPPVRLASGVEVRVACAQPGDDAGPWILLYCEVQTPGGQPVTMLQNNVRMPLGPLDVRVRVTKKEDRRLEQLKRDELLYSVSWSMAAGIYCVAVPLEEIGTFQVTLQSGATVVATRDVEVKEVRPLYWQSLILPPGNRQKLPEGMPSPAAIRTVPAIPTYGGMHPVWEAKPAKAVDVPAALKRDNGGLPGTLPMNAEWTSDPSTLPAVSHGAASFPLSLTMEKQEFVIKARSKSFTVWPEHQLLARWWLNGKPVPAPGLPNLATAEQQAMLNHKPTEEVRVGFNYPESLGVVKEGDKIALQVLYAPDGFATGPELMQPAKTDAGQMPLLTNKLEFVVTKEMVAAHEREVKLAEQ